MSRNTEAALVGLAAALAGAGAVLAPLADGDLPTYDVLLAPAVFLAAFGGLLLAVRRWAPRATRTLLPLAAFLTAVGWVEVSRLDRDLGRLQLWWLLVGTALAGTTLFVLRRRGVGVLRRYRYLFLVTGLGLLLLPLLPSSWPVRGLTLNGSRLWVRFQAGDLSLSFQPGEAAKILIVAFLASYLADRHRALTGMPRRLGPLSLPEPRQLLPVLLAFGVSFAVLVYQRDLGASVLLFLVFAAMLFAATGRFAYPAAALALLAGGGLAAYQYFGHVRLRVEAWLHPFADFAGTGYQVAQGLFALGSGGLTGTGLGAGRPDLIPAAATDFVFAAVSEELGLAGGLAVIAAYALLVAAGFGIALRARDPFRKLLAGGLTLTLAVQTVLIVGGILRLLPLTGITLPFMSYGGSSLLANLVLVALLARISHEEGS
ncbi:MAG: FtsW/RodA/SpoVE family cell cycle protein [Acidimicrobiia bacterium]|nr:FtsW/RodA/SpoVE family cell cycle protein [Acidimicrobiia bacterium]